MNKKVLRVLQDHSMQLDRLEISACSLLGLSQQDAPTSAGNPAAQQTGDGTLLCINMRCVFHLKDTEPEKGYPSFYRLFLSFLWTNNCTFNGFLVVEKSIQRFLARFCHLSLCLIGRMRTVHSIATLQALTYPQPVTSLVTEQLVE